MRTFQPQHFNSERWWAGVLILCFEDDRKKINLSWHIHDVTATQTVTGLEGTVQPPAPYERLLKKHHYSRSALDHASCLYLKGQ